MAGRQAQAGRMGAALERALTAVPMDAQDVAVAEIARLYAAQIDADPGRLADVGPKLLAVLVELRLTPKARAAVVKGGTSDDDGDKPSALADYRDRARSRRAAAMDSSAPRADA